jgi:hypothetical protein
MKRKGRRQAPFLISVVTKIGSFEHGLETLRSMQLWNPITSTSLRAGFCAQNAQRWGAHGPEDPSGKPLLALLLDQLQINLDLHVVADHGFAGFQSVIVGQAEIFAV